MVSAVDIGIDMLHTIILGAVKYVWKDMFDMLAKSQPPAEAFEERLQESNMLGSSISTIHATYIMKYANSLVGVYLRQIIQLAPFCLNGLVDDKLAAHGLEKHGKTHRARVVPNNQEYPPIPV